MRFLKLPSDILAFGICMLMYGIFIFLYIWFGQVAKRRYVVRPGQSDRAFLAYLREYNETLSRHVSPVFKESSSFVETGPLVGTMKEESINVTTKPKKILTWTSFFGQDDYLPSELCAGENLTCLTTSNKDELLTSDAVFFHPRDITSLPGQRLPNQRWVYYNMEPPFLSGIDFSGYNGVFNWTSTYRLDSDFPVVYGKFAPLRIPLSDSEYDGMFSAIMSKKRNLVAAIISNCHAHSPRQEYIVAIRQYLPVDYFGSCGELSCNKDSSECDEKISSYKFFLSFENSQCRDYITEKAWNPLFKWNSVPIVLGAPKQSYARVMPPGSYIHIEGFRSIEKLAEYILVLDDNPGLYEKYHAWRRSYGKVTSSHLCDLCKGLHDLSLPTKSYTDFQGWYDQDICFPKLIEYYIIMIVVSILAVCGYIGRCLKGVAWRCSLKKSFK